MTVFRARFLWTCISLLAFVVHTARCSYLYDDCTVRYEHNGVEIKTFRDSLRVTIAKSEKDNDVTIGIKGKTTTTKIPNLPEKQWTEVECRVSGHEEVQCGAEMASPTENDSGGLTKEFVIRNAEVLANCPQGLANKNLPQSTWIAFPRWNSTEERFAVVPEVDRTVQLDIFGENHLFFCWDGNQTTVKEGEEVCQGLPARKVHKITLDYASHEIKSPDGRILRNLSSTNANKDDLMKMRTEGGNAWVVQSLGDWPHPQDQDQSSDNEMEGTCKQSQVILIVLLVLFITTTIALIILHLRKNLSRSLSASSPEFKLNAAREGVASEHPHRRDSGVETINDIYGFEDQ